MSKPEDLRSLVELLRWQAKYFIMHEHYLALYSVWADKLEALLDKEDEDERDDS